MRTATYIHAIAQAAVIYQQSNSGEPTFDDVLASGALAGVPLEEFSRALPAAQHDASLPLVVQTVPSQAESTRERRSGPDKTTDQDLPPSRLILMPDWTIVEMPEPDYQRDIAPRVRLAPLR